jgi:hypothetical protein
MVVTNFLKAAIFILAILVCAALVAQQISKIPQDQTVTKRSVLY